MVLDQRRTLLKSRTAPILTSSQYAADFWFFPIVKKDWRRSTAKAIWRQHAIMRKPSRKFPGVSWRLVATTSKQRLRLRVKLRSRDSRAKSQVRSFRLLAPSTVKTSMPARRVEVSKVNRRYRWIVRDVTPLQILLR